MKISRYLRYLDRHAALHAALVITVIGLGVDIFMRRILGTSICPTESCAIVGDYIRISEHNLVSLGLVFFAVLWGVYFFASRYQWKWLWTVAGVLLLGALAFDGGLLGFQYFSINEQCHLCFGVGAALLVILFLFALVQKKFMIIVLGISVWVGGGIAGSMINIPDKAPALERIRGIAWSVPEAEDWPRFHYFFSLHCPHCTDVLAGLASRQTGDYRWNLLPMDSSPADLRKIARAMELDPLEENVFQEIVRLEQTRSVPNVAVPDDLVDRIDQIRAYFRASGFRGVPVLVAEEGPYRRVVVTGGSHISDYLNELGVIN